MQDEPLRSALREFGTEDLEYAAIGFAIGEEVGIKGTRGCLMEIVVTPQGKAAFA